MIISTNSFADFNLFDYSSSIKSQKIVKTNYLNIACPGRSLKHTDMKIFNIDFTYDK